MAASNTTAKSWARILCKLEVPLLIVVPLTLALCVYFNVAQAALLSLVVVIAALVVCAAGFETSRPALRQIMPIVVLAALAIAGRLLFAAIPDVQPVTAICIIAGIVFGRRSGFMVGALAALVSNMFLGQGPWTPWQMYAWGLAGYLGGVLYQYGAFKRSWTIYVWGFVLSFLYGFILDSFYVVGYVNPLTWQGALAAYGAGAAFNIGHAISTSLFLALIYAPWKRKLERIRRKYGEY